MHQNLYLFADTASTGKFSFQETLNIDLYTTTTANVLAENGVSSPEIS